MSNGAETAGQTRDANNAGANERGRQAGLAPAEQGSSAAETEITATIRKGILADDALGSSPDVKVATVGTKVTLRGPVKSDKAKLAIAEIAMRTVGVSEVDNQLVVTD
ncbi:MAG: BON domain-containing protein [Deltaproteobacteria bacterium]|nr:BON domain-containing protein [Deltaproteobacteria bacterium]